MQQCHLEGTYAVSGSGWVVTGRDGAPLESPRPITVLGLLVADGDGNTTFTPQTGDPTTLIGHYTVNADCTFSGSNISREGTESQWVGIVLSGGNKAFQTLTGPGPVLSFTWERV